ncbi:hypothetical protein BaRGS_00001615 [Batillaria attramentaria]|uniref:Uncharacterized protein n=1 Tax=Batillaria attramentaria TaxID=370345 RepID=A0ABD0M6V3_9CAEN
MYNYVLTTAKPLNPEQSYSLLELKYDSLMAASRESFLRSVAAKMIGRLYGREMAPMPTLSIDSRPHNVVRMTASPQVRFLTAFYHVISISLPTELIIEVSRLSALRLSSHGECFP